MQELMSPSPGEKNSSTPSFMKRTCISGLPRAHLMPAATQAWASALSDLRNLSLAGVL